MAQDSTPAFVIYKGDGSNNVFPIPFDKGYYGEVKVAFVRRGLTEYHYYPDTFIAGIPLYAWTTTSMGSSSTIYTRTPIPHVPEEEEEEPEYTKIYDEYGNETTSVVTAYEDNAIQINWDDTVTYVRDEDADILQHEYLTWTGDTLSSDDYICIVRETEKSQPFVFPANQKHIEDALDNLERQIQELNSVAENVMIVDPSGEMSPIDWMETIVRCTDLSARELRYYNGWLQYSLTDPKSASADKQWYSLLNTDNIKNLFYRYTEDEEGRPLYNVYYTDRNGDEHLLAYDAETQRIDIEDLKVKVEQNRQSIEGEKSVRRVADDELRQLILNSTQDVSRFNSRITQNTNNIAKLDSRLDSTVTASDKAMPKSYIDSLVSGIYHIKGVKPTVDDLPTEGNVTGDCWNVLADGNTYIWTEDEEWVSGGAAVDFSPYRKAVDQDIIDAGKQDKLTAGTNMEITANNTINMTGKFGKTIASSGKNLTLKDQDGNVLSQTIVSLGVDAEYDSNEEDIEFEDGEAGDYSFIQEQIDSINRVIPNNATGSNKLVANSDIGRADLIIQKNGTELGTFNANDSTTKTINVTVPVDADDVHALPDTTKYAANISLSINSSTYVITAQLKDQTGANIGSAQTIDLPLETVVVSGRYDSTNKKIVLILKDGSTIDIPVGDLIAGLQTEITPQNKLSSDLVDDSNATHKFVTTQDKTNWDNKVTKTTGVSKVYGTDSTGAQTTYDVNSFGQVDDVQVDGVSVVANKIANIDLTGKQNKLTPGTNITIEGDVISATGAAVPTFATIEGSPYDNTNLATELNKKITQDVSLTLFPVGEEEEHVGEIRQYIGPDYPSSGKFHGYFYQWTKTQLGEHSYSYGWEQWNVQPQGGGAVSELTDVTLTNLADGQVLVYDSASSKWVNEDQHGGVTATYNAETKTITFA